MTYDPRRPEDVLRVLGEGQTPSDDAARLRARRERTVAHLRGLQARAAVRREMHTSFRRRLLVAAALLISSAALGASGLIPWGRIAGEAWVEAPATSSNVPTERRRHGRATPRPSPPPSAESGASSATSMGVAPVEEPGPSSEPAPAAVRATPSLGGDDGTRGRPREVRDPSTLADENRLMQSALAAARDGRSEDEIKSLSELLARYPRSPLSQNAMVERFRALARRGDTSSAERQARRYLELYPNGMASDEARRYVHGHGDVTR